MKKALAAFLVISLIIIMQVQQIFAENTFIVDSASLYKSKSLYEATEEAILRLHSRFPGITSVENIGESVQGRDIKAMKIGKGEKKIFINGAHHGKEWVTTVLILEQMEYLLREYERNGIIRGYNVKEMLEKGSIYFVPLVNPDGAEIARGTTANPYNVNRNQYKANARGVDLNRNYPAKWEHINQVKKPGPKNYKGSAPFSEPETKAIEEFVRANAFDSVLCYHSAGNLVYWYYNQRSNLQRDYKLALKLGEITGYTVEKPEEAAKYHYAEGDMPGSMGGMKDWFVQEFEKPGFTIEVGSTVAENAIVSYEEYFKIWKSNCDIPICLLAEFISNESESLTYARKEKMTGHAEQESKAAKVQGIVLGKTLNQVEYTNTVSICDKPKGKAIASLKTGSPIKVLSLAYDGWYKVLTDKYTIGYIDCRYVSIGPEYNNPLPSKNMLKGKKTAADYITVVNQNKQTIEIYKKNNDIYEKIAEAPVSTGAVETPTPNGWFTVKSSRGEYSFIPKYQLGIPYFVQLKGGYLLHGLPMNAKRQVPKEISDALGRKDSHGCIRLPLELAKFVHEQLKESSIVVIDNDPPEIERIIKWIKDAS